MSPALTCVGYSLLEADTKSNIFHVKVQVAKRKIGVILYLSMK